MTEIDDESVESETSDSKALTSKEDENGPKDNGHNPFTFALKSPITFVNSNL